jgi:hypothetical protein
MTQVIVRYGCDGGCVRYFEDKDELTRVDIQQFRGLTNGEPIWFTDRFESWCKDCLDKSSVDKKYRDYEGPRRTNPGFKIVNS